jgi:hypothetical protein
MNIRVWVALGCLAIGTSIAACGSSSPAESPGPDSGASHDATAEAAPHPDSGASVQDSGASSNDGTASSYPDAFWPDDAVSGPGFLACNADPPEGAPQAAPFPTYAGSCPMLVAAAPAEDGGAPIQNTITSSGNQRQFLLAIPANLQPSEKLPVIFMWHWLKGSDTDFYNTGAIQQAVDQQRFLAVMPQSKGDLVWEWPFAISDTAARTAEEIQFFDDLLACVAAQFPTANRNCVASAGVSAGALWTDQLGWRRADHLSSIESMSGGVGGLAQGWTPPSHALPALILWGGPNDECAVMFQAASQDLEQSMKPSNDFIVECIHNCGHSVPPIVAPPGQSQFASMWDFMFDHPYWLAPGQSPYNVTGLPSDYPTWCAIGAGNATIRTGACNPPACSTP